MTVYFDSSALVSVYVTETYSERARRELRKRGRVPWTPLHDLEGRNALRLLHGRRQIDEAELEGLLGHIDDDLQRGRLARPSSTLEPRFDVPNSSRGSMHRRRSLAPSTFYTSRH